jgi:hypothetical protein
MKYPLPIDDTQLLNFLFTLFKKNSCRENQTPYLSYLTQVDHELRLWDLNDSI